MEIRGVVEGWPTLMSIELASSYLSLSEDAFLRLVQDRNLHPVEIDGAAAKWRKQDLDRLVRRLPVSPQIANGNDTTRLFRLHPGQIDEIVESLSRKLAPRPTEAKRKLVSIREASVMLGVGRSSIYRMIEDGRLTTTHIGRRTLVHVEAVNAVVEDRSTV